MTLLTIINSQARMFVADGGKSCKSILLQASEPWRPEMSDYANATEIGCYELWQLHRERNDLCKLSLEAWAAIEGLDGILSPTTPYSTVEHGNYKHVGYTAMWNIVDYPAVTFPSGCKVDRDIDAGVKTEGFLGKLDEEIQSICK
jgi:amidase